MFQSASILMEFFVLEKDHDIVGFKDDPRLICFANFEAHLSVYIENVLYK